MNPYSEFTCLYTNQKLKKAKTWQDGHIRYFHNNSKVVLYNVKFAVLDSSFHRGATITAGDDLDMDRHLITIEDLTMAYATNSADQLKPANRTQPQSTATPRTSIPKQGVVPTVQSPGMGSYIAGSTNNISDRTLSPSTHNIPRNDPTTRAPLPSTTRKKWRPPFADRGGSNASELHDDGLTFDEDFGYDCEPASNLNNSGSSSTLSYIPGNVPSAAKAPPPREQPNPAPPVPKRRRVGLSKGPSAVNIQGQGAVISPHRPPSTQLEFPNAARCVNFSGKNSSQLLRRTITLPCRFTSTSQYKEGLAYLIYEHLQILVIEIAMSMWGVKNNGNLKDGDSFDALYRSRGIHMHSGTTLRRRGDSYSGFPMFSGRSDAAGSGQSATLQIAQQQGAVLSITNKEHHSKYSKDDLWVVSKTPRFDSSSTFFARSVFYGPSGSDIEVTCLSSKDSSTARDMFTNTTGVCAIRLINGMSEFMMIDNLENLMRTPILPTILNYIPPELVKASRTSVFKVPSRVPEKSGCIVLTKDDGINVEMEIRDTVEKYSLNDGQASVLRNFALTVIRAPEWGDKSEPPPILLVHGVFGAGKSFLIAVLIVFVNAILSKARPLPREERSCRFLVTSMTNVAVDRILMALLDLNYTNFVRVGSLKKVARRILPFTAQSNSSRGEDIKELQSILDDDSISSAERRYVKDAMKRFTKHQNRGIVEGADVVGATCNASTFEVLDDATFPIVILDEASQLLEPMSLIPICRAAGEKLILVGDPLQLSPPLNTNSDNTTANKGLSRTLFDRSIEMGIKPLMLRTQYRCHQRIANISNTLFYSNNLKTGSSPSDRAPLIEGLPTLTFIDNTGQEIQNAKTKSFTNPAEIKLVVKLVQRLLILNIPDTSIGVISLYKSQADSIQFELSESLKNTGHKGAVQISTVDAFQGSEKDIIIVSTVRTDSIGFADNHQRVNVALTRSKRHLFIVGNSQLLSSNRLWGSVISGHCKTAEPDGMMHGDDFVRKLLSLQPLPRILSESRLQESEDEDEEVEDEEEDKMDAYDHEDDDHYHDDDDDDDDFYYRTASKPNTSESGQSASVVVPRSYALYAADDDDSDDSEDEIPISRTQSSSNSSAPPPAHKTRSPYVPKGDAGQDVMGSYSFHDQRHGTVLRNSGQMKLPPTPTVESQYGESAIPAVIPRTPALNYGQTRTDIPKTRGAPIPNCNQNMLVATTVGSYIIPEHKPNLRTSDSARIDRPSLGARTGSTYFSAVPGNVKVETVVCEPLDHSETNIGERGVKGPEKAEEEVVWEMDEDEDAHSSSLRLDQPTVTTTIESQRIEDLYVEGFSQMPAVGNTISPAQQPVDTVFRLQTYPPSHANRSDLSVGVEEDDILCLEVGDLDAF